MYEVVDYSQQASLLVGADTATQDLSESTFDLLLCLLSMLDDADRWRDSYPYGQSELPMGAYSLLAQAVWEVMPNA